MEAQKYRTQTRAYPNDRIDAAAYLRAAEHRRGMPAAKLGRPPVSSPAKAIDRRPRNERNSVSRSGVRAARVDIGQTAGRWRFLGPRNMTVPYQPTMGPVGSFISGRVNDVAYDPIVPSTAYLASATGGVWKTTNLNDPVGPVLWTPLSDTFPFLYTSSVAVHPVNNRIVYVGLGDFDGGEGRGLGLGILKSTNGGGTFTNIGNPQLAGTAVSAIVIDPENPEIVTAATGRGTVVGRIWRSINGGNTWTNTTPTVGGDWSDIDIGARSAAGVRYYYATCQGVGLFQSADQGATWTPINNPLLVYNRPGVVGPFGFDVAASRADPNTVYLMDSSAAFDNGKMYRSINAGRDWEEVTGTFPAVEGSFNNWSEASYSSHLTVAAVTQPDAQGVFRLYDQVYGGVRTLAGSVGGPLDWRNIAITDTAAQTHGNQHALAYNPLDSTQMLLANDGGVSGFRYTPGVYNPSLGTPPGTWAFNNTLNRTLGVTQFYTADFHPTDPNQALGGTHNNGVAVSRGDLNNWRTLENAAPAPNGVAFLIGPFGGGCTYHPLTPSVQYATTPEGVWPNRRYLYTNTAWGTTAPPSGQVAVTAIDISPDRYFLVGPSLLPLRDANGAILYVYPYRQPNSGFATGFAGEAKAFAGPVVVDPATGAMYTGGTSLYRFDPPPDASPVPVTTPPTTPSDVGRWRRIGGPLAGAISAIAITESGNRIYVGTTNGRVWMTRTARMFTNPTDPDAWTGSWIDLTANSANSLPNQPINAISVNPDNVSSDILVGLGGTGTGHVYRSANTLGSSFLFTNQSGVGAAALPNVPVNAIARGISTPTEPGNATSNFFVATDIGVFTTINEGSNWSDATSPLGLPNVECTALKLIRYPSGQQYLNVATFGRGIWQFDITANNTPVTTPVNLQVTPTLGRSGGDVLVTVTVRNAPGSGVANNVQVTRVALDVNGTTTETATTLPVVLGTIGSGLSKYTTVRFPGSVGTVGSSATLRVTTTYAGAAAPVELIARTRLP